MAKSEHHKLEKQAYQEMFSGALRLGEVNYVLGYARGRLRERGVETTYQQATFFDLLSKDETEITEDFFVRLKNHLLNSNESLENSIETVDRLIEWHYG